MFRFRTSALPWLPKIWSSASALSLLPKIWSSTSALSFWIDCHKCEVPLPHFRSALTAKYVKFCFRTSALPWLAKIWSSAFRTFCQDFQRCEVPLPHLISAWTSTLVLRAGCGFYFPKICSFAIALSLSLDCQRSEIGFSTNTLPSLPNMGSSASALPFCLDCKGSVISHFRSAFIPKDVNALLLCLDCQRSASSVPL